MRPRHILKQIANSNGSFTIGVPVRNKILSLSPDVTEQYGRNISTGDAPFIQTVGMPIGALYGYVEDGYYFYSDSFAQQTTADREARKSMPVNVALKYSGFMHSADILITLNQ